MMVAVAKRADRLNETRNLKMARSAHAYVRGSTAKFYEWLENSAGKLPDGPPVWICGDCHVGNLGPLADADGNVAIQIRDLDQTVIGNPAHDLIRLGLSLASAVRGSDLPGVVTARVVEQVVAGYARALSGDFEPDDKGNRPQSIKALMRRSLKRRWRHLAAERLQSVKPVIPLGKRFWPLSVEERAALAQLFAEPAVAHMVTLLQERADTDPVTVLDAAYWSKGCSSLGRLRFAVMLQVGEGKTASSCFVDVKEATAAAAPRVDGATMPRDNAARVVAGAQTLSPHLGDRMISARLLGRGVAVRELMPQDLKFEIGRLCPEEATELAYYLAAVVGVAHARQMDPPTRSAWAAELAKAKTTSLEAPSWLWSNIVELLAIHERAYLEHCRRFALTSLG